MPRIISLIASATEIVCALGAGDALVGRSHECDYPPAVLSLPPCSKPGFDVSGTSPQIDARVKDRLRDALSVYDVLDQVLEQLQPTHIVTQTQCDVCAVSLQDVERSVAAKLSSRPQIVALQPNCLADIWDDIRRVAVSLGMPERGKELVNELQRRMQPITQKRRPTVACIEWLNPLMAAGNWMPELVELAGGINLFGEVGRHSPWLQWEQVREADPDFLIAMPCGFDLEKTRQEMHWLEELPGYRALRAVQSGCVVPVDGNAYFNRPGPRLADSFDQLVAIIQSFG